MAAALIIVAHAASPSSLRAQLPGTSSDDNIAPALAVYGLSIAAAYFLFNPPDPVFAVTGSELATAQGRARLASFGEPVAVRVNGLAKWAVTNGEDVGTVQSAGDGDLTIIRGGQSKSFTSDQVNDVTDLASAAIRAKELRTSLSIFAFGSAAAVFMLADGQPEEGGSKILMQLSGALVGAMGVYMLISPSVPEKLAAEYESTGRLAVLPAMTWQPDGGIGVGVAGRWHP